MESKKAKLQKRIRKYNISLITIVIMIIIIGVCVVIAYEKSKQQLPEPINMANVNKADEYASIDVSLLTEPFAEKDEQKCSFALDKNNYMYVVVLSEIDTERLKEVKNYTYTEDENVEIPDIVKIKGMTQQIPSDLKKLIIESYNELYEENLINEENFEEYLGNVFLDTRLSPVNYSLELFIGIVSAIFAIAYIRTMIITKSTLKKYTLNGSLDYIYDQLDEIDTLEYNKGKTFLTREYILDTSDGLVIIKYDEIKWVYPYSIVQYGITTSKTIVIVKNDKRRVQIAGIAGFGKKEKMEMYNEVYYEICRKSPNALKGYTEENKKISKNM
ncbi:MAG: hypothetical protein K0R72_1095 [Clostridia bacterium]|jgi:hypothetical protein|nr:hypothetical protein [Clostridia bacterium]